MSDTTEPQPVPDLMEALKASLPPGWCYEESCELRHWRSGSTPTHRRGDRCPPPAPVQADREWLDEASTAVTAAVDAHPGATTKVEVGEWVTYCDGCGERLASGGDVGSGYAAYERHRNEAVILAALPAITGGVAAAIEALPVDGPDAHFIAGMIEVPALGHEVVEPTDAQVMEAFGDLG